MMILFLLGMLLLTVLAAWRILHFLHQEWKDWHYRIIQVGIWLGIASLIMRYSGQFYRLEQEALRQFLLMFSSMTLLWLLVATLLQLVISAWNRRHKAIRSSIMLAVSLCLTIGLYAGGSWQAKRLHVRTYEIEVAQDAEKTDMLLISDLHLGSGMDKQRIDEVYERMEKMRGDALLISGDLFDESTPASLLRYFCEKNAASSFHDTTYYAIGNHEALSANKEAYLTLMRESGIHVLLDEATQTKNHYCMIGRVDNRKLRKDLTSLQATCQTGQEILVIDHRPRYEKDVLIALQVSGHTHKGQIVPNTWFTNIAYPNDYGYYQEPYPLIVTSGVGTWGLPLRLGTQADIVKISLLPKDMSISN